MCPGLEMTLSLQSTHRNRKTNNASLNSFPGGALSRLCTVWICLVARLDRLVEQSGVGQCRLLFVEVFLAHLGPLGRLGRLARLVRLARLARLGGLARFVRLARLVPLARLVRMARKAC